MLLRISFPLLCLQHLQSTSRKGELGNKSYCKGLISHIRGMEMETKIRKKEMEDSRKEKSIEIVCVSSNTTLRRKCQKNGK